MNGKPWTAADDRMMRKHYPHRSSGRVAAMLERTIAAVYGRANTLGLNKSAKYLASQDACRLRRGDNVGAAYRYPKGHVPANKGLRRPGWTAGRMRETQFKKGQPNHNVMPIGTERLIDGYLYVKVAAVRYMPYMVNWLPVHILDWERANRRQLPAGHVLWFRDGDRTNVALENLELITRSELMSRNTIHNLPKPLKRVITARAALNRKLNRLEKESAKQHA